jgi:uncharacterized protein
MEQQSSDGIVEEYHTTYSSAPRVPNVHLFRAGTRHMLLSVTRGQIYEIDDILAQTIDRTMDYGDSDRVGQFLAAAGIFDSTVPEQPPASVPVRALSLAVAQKCNLGCTYCYAQQGNFGGPDSSMSIDVARAAVDRLLENAPPGEKVSLAYLGGEPLVSRSVLRAATEYAAKKAAAAGVEIAFALTTNATLLTEADAEFFERYAFAITVSIDGVRETHNRLRPFKSGQGSYDRVVERSKLMLSRSPRLSHVTARVTVTPRNLRLQDTLDELIQLGFDGVLFSPVLSSPTGADQMDKSEFDAMLAQLIECGGAFERQLRDNNIYPFLNVISTLRRIHQQNRDAYPCGAGGGYLGVSSKGGFYACHRFVDDDLGAMGNVADGVDRTKQRRWLSDRNVHTQEPCRTCWARYLCSGGCHHEAIHRGRPACDYIRGWLHYCLSLYGTLLKDNPPLLGRILNPRQWV